MQPPALPALQVIPALAKDLLEATEKADNHQWAKAADIYRHIVEKLDQTTDPAQTAEIVEQLANSNFRAAFQADTRDQFRNYTALSEESWQRVAQLYEAAGSEALAKRAKARALFASFWLLDDPDEKHKVLEKCMPLAQGAAQIFEVHADKQHLVETLLDLLVYREKALHLSRNRNELLDQFESATETAWRIIDDESLANNPVVLESTNILAQLYVAADYVLEKPRYEELERRLEKLKDRILPLAEKIGTTRADALATEASMILAADLEGDIPKTTAYFERALSKAKELRDHFMIGRLSTSAAAMARWAALSEEYVEKRREQLENAAKLAQNAIDSLQPSSPGAWMKRAYGVQVDSSNYIALTVETDIDKKRSVLREAINTTRKSMTYERHSFLTGMGHQLSRAMYLLATMDVGPEEKTRLLKEALPIREDSVRTLELLSPHSFSRGMMLNYLALIKFELSKAELDPARKLEFLRAAASDMQQCMALCATITGIVPPLPGQIRAQAQFSEWQGDILQELYNATLDTATARQAINAYEQTILQLSKALTQGAIPLIRWKIAQTHDSLREYVEASEAFNRAAEEYRLAAKKLPNLAPVFEDFAHYMNATAVIEDARRNHYQELYQPAAEAYTNVAGLLRTTRSWNHLSKHYSACSFLELGEALGRQERQHAAIESFNSAQGSFREALNDLEAKLSIIESSQDRKDLEEWLEITQGRLKYTVGRVQFEEAKLLDARGDDEGSAAKYRTASENFAALLRETRHVQTRRELDALALVCDAWAKLKLAEAQASSELYSEAAETFTKLEKASSGKKARLTALANASMCKALESGSLFRRSRNVELYRDIKQRLEAAADFYEQANNTKAADWTRATERLFDALTYLRDAEVQTDSGKKKELYHLSEKHLQLAAKLFEDAGYPRKRQEALRHLQHVREEKQVLLAPVEVLAESPAVTEVTATPVSLIREPGLGPERFENGNITGRMTISEREVQTGEIVTVNLEISNISKPTVTLVRVENVATKELQPTAEKTPYPFEDSVVNMRGKRLEYLKSEQLKISLRARRKGAYSLGPRVVFVDEKGAEGSYQFEPMSLTVTELGVLGWLKGPGR